MKQKTIKEEYKQMNRKLRLPEEQRFEKVVEYYYPNGNKFYGSRVSFYLLNLIGYIIGIGLALLFSESNYKCSRKVYWRKIK